MSISKRILILLFNVLLFALLWNVYIPHQKAWRKAAAWGNATPEVRTDVLRQLQLFQDGYTKRDVKQLDAFMDRVFSRERPVVLGTMPGEIYIDYSAAAEVVRTDWESWGDCRFRLDETEVSSVGDVAWFATVGSVKFDLSRFLVLPLRLTGVMVNEHGTWKIRQAQFQFDLDLSPLLAADFLLVIWMAINLVLLAIAVYRRVVGIGSQSPSQSKRPSLPTV
jgi:hypothetical protein